MKRAIYDRWNSSMAGYEWRWVFYLEKCPDGTFTLSAEQELIEADEDDEPFEIAPVSGLRRGADVYEQFQGMVSEAQVRILVDEIDAVADIVAEMDATVGDHFRRGEELLHRRYMRERRMERARIDARLERHRSAIEEQVAGLDDTPERVSGITVPSPKDRVRRYLECHIERGEELPGRESAIALALGTVRLADILDGTAPEGWIRVPFQRVSGPNGTGGICPFCGHELHLRPLAPRWNVRCRCGARIHYLGMAGIKAHG